MHITGLTNSARQFVFNTKTYKLSQRAFERTRVFSYTCILLFLIHDLLFLPISTIESAVGKRFITHCCVSRLACSRLSGHIEPHSPDFKREISLPEYTHYARVSHSRLWCYYNILTVVTLTCHTLPSQHGMPLLPVQRFYTEKYRQGYRMMFMRGIHSGLCSPETPTLTELAESIDDALFQRTMHNPYHVIHHLLPARRELPYNIRQRHHNRQLSSGQLHNRSFIYRMLFKDCY